MVKLPERATECMCSTAAAAADADMKEGGICATCQYPLSDSPSETVVCGNSTTQAASRSCSGQRGVGESWNVITQL